MIFLPGDRVLVTTVLGLAAVDRDVNANLGIAGDGLGVLDLALTIIYLFIGFA